MTYTDEAASSGVQREDPKVDPATKSRVEAWTARVKAAKKHWDEKVFPRMRECQDIAVKGYGSGWSESQYSVPIVQRHINNSVAELYARNPRFTAKRKRRLNYPNWDGTLLALQKIEAAAQAGDPMAMATLQEISSARLEQEKVDRIGKTLEILAAYYTSEQEPNFKVQLKQLVRRAKVNGVAYIDLRFQRIMEPDPDVTAQLADVRGQIEAMEAILRDMADGLLQDDSEKLDELRTMQADLQSRENILVREGPVFEFPRSTEVIVDPAVRQLRGFIGAGWVAREFHLTPERVKELYKIDVGTNYMGYTGPKQKTGKELESRAQDAPTKGDVCLWRVQDARTQEEFIVADGYSDFIVAPAAPTPRLERFWTLFPLTFNDIEHEEDVFPLSDVWLLRHPQAEYNRAREGLREHRIANRPAYMSGKGALDPAEKAKLETRQPHQVIELGAITKGVKAADLLQRVEPVPIDPALYDTNMVFDDVLRAVGSQEANIGGTNADSATQSSIAEGGRQKGLSSNVDDLDEMLTDLGRALGQMMLMELDEQTVKKIAGVGALWPQLTREEVAAELYLDVKAGSSGRPNKAMELANMERGMPFIQQMPGSASIAVPLLEKYLDLLEVEYEDAIIAASPSITALNQIMGKPVAAPMGGAPAAQGPAGAAGADNAPQPPANEPGAQPAFPSDPAAVTDQTMGGAMGGSV